MANTLYAPEGTKEPEESSRSTRSIAHMVSTALRRTSGGAFPGQGQADPERHALWLRQYAAKLRFRVCPRTGAIPQAARAGRRCRNASRTAPLMRVTRKSASAGSYPSTDEVLRLYCRSARK